MVQDLTQLQKQDSSPHKVLFAQLGCSRSPDLDLCQTGCGHNSAVHGLDVHNDHCNGKRSCTFSKTLHQKSHIWWSNNDELVGKHLTRVVEQNALQGLAEHQISRGEASPFGDVCGRVQAPDAAWSDFRPKSASTSGCLKLPCQRCHLRLALVRTSHMRVNMRAKGVRLLRWLQYLRPR